MMVALTQETLFSNECGDIVYFRQLDLYGYYHRDKNDGKTDDCTYYFKFHDHEVIPYTFYYGNPDNYDAVDALESDNHSWVYDEDFHTTEYQQYIINCLYQCVCTYAFERV